MYPLERVARLEEVIGHLDDIATMFIFDEAAVWNHEVEGDPGFRRVEFLKKIALSIGVLKNQVEYELNLLSDDESGTISLVSTLKPI
jgi:hypothetical protein